MASGSSWLSIWRLAWPLVASMFLQFAVGLTDVFVAGRFGPSVQGAVGFGGQVLFLFSVIANALGVGLVAVVSRNEGAGDSAGAWHAARQGVLLSVLVAGPLSLAGVLLSPGPEALRFLPPAVARSAEALLPWYGASLLPQAVLTISAAVFRARGRAAWVLGTMGFTAVLNLACVFALAFGAGPIPAMGPVGIVVATAGSSLAGALAALFVLMRQGLAAGRSAWRLDPELARRLAALGWPVGLLQLGWNLGGLALYAILGRLGVDAVAATAALTNGLRIEAVLYLPAFALNMVAAVLVGRSLGAGHGDEAETTGWRVAGSAAVVLTLMALPVFAQSRGLAALLSPDPAVREATHLYLRFNMVSQPFMAFSMCLGGALQGAGDTRGPMTVVLGALWGLRIPLALGLALGTTYGSTGVWAAMVSSQVVQGFWMAARFRRGRWKHA